MNELSEFVGLQYIQLVHEFEHVSMYCLRYASKFPAESRVGLMTRSSSETQHSEHGEELCQRGTKVIPTLKTILQHRQEVPTGTV